MGFSNSDQIQIPIYQNLFVHFRSRIVTLSFWLLRTYRGIEIPEAPCRKI